MATYLNYITDKLGDATIYMLDEFKFWGEVVTEFMEYDQSSSDKYLEDYRKDIRDQIQEAEEAQKEVDEMLEEQKDREDDQNSDIIQDDENKI